MMNKLFPNWDDADEVLTNFINRYFKFCLIPSEELGPSLIELSLISTEDCVHPDSKIPDNQLKNFMNILAKFYKYIIKELKIDTIFAKYKYYVSSNQAIHTMKYEIDQEIMMYEHRTGKSIKDELMENFLGIKRNVIIKISLDGGV